MGTEPVDTRIADGGLRIADFCRQIESYLCRKNDGHLIRVTGPSFDLVAGWAASGVPLKIAFEGIDRCFERYYRKGPRRRPVKIDFCEADVLDVFDEWRRALGLSISPAQTADSGGVDRPSPEPKANPRSPSLTAHLERVVMRLSEARARGAVGDEFDALIDRVCGELDAARAKAGGLRGDARQALLARLAALDGELVAAAWAGLDDSARRDLARAADEELSTFRSRLSPEALADAQARAMAHLVRERFGLPSVAIA